MKKILRSITWALASMFVLVACTDSLDENAANGNSGEFTGEKGYVNIGINLPTTNGGSSRAYTESFDDGDEYKVKDVIIALFYGENETKATCKHAFKISGDAFKLSGTTTDNVTTYSASGVRMISAPDDNEKVFALAIINARSSVFDVITTEETDKTNEDKGEKVLTTGLKVNNSSSAYTQDLSQLNDAIAAANISYSEGENDSKVYYYFMTNAPIAVGSSINAQTLAPISVYNSKKIAEGEAKNNPIYVERAAAKVTVSVTGGSDNTLTVGPKYPHYDGATVKFLGWELQNTNEKFLPVRNVTGFDTWKGYNVSNNRFISSAKDPCRILWAVDNNYQPTNDGEGLISINPGPETGMSWNNMGSNDYCTENTTDYNKMSSKNLTSVLLKANFKLKGGKDSDNLFMLNNLAAIYTETEFLKWVENVLINANLPVSGTLSINNTQGGQTITTWESIQTLIIVNGNSNQLSEQQATALLNAAGKNIKYYKGGVTYYYAAVIKHFGDDETPIGNTVIDNVDNYNANDHLGRFGVVRNTWYTLNINSVSGPGEPEIPEIPTTPPDKTASYINCEINVLSWAKRTQGVDL